MNETLQQYLQKLKAYTNQLSAQKKWGIAALAILISVAGAVGLVILRQDPYQILYTDLQGEDARAITKKLSEFSIPHHMVDETTVSVPTSQVAIARMQLAKAGLPGQDVVGFEKFDASTLGMSSYVQRIQYVRAVQGELTRSIQRLSSVKHARVHISVPPKKTFLEDEDPPKASVVLELRPGQVPSKQEMNGIAHLVASAVEGLKVNQVTIVDTKGNFLHRPEDGTSPGVNTALLEMQRSIESEYERRIEDILTPVVGMGKVRAKVTAEIDPSRTNTTEETFDPEKAVIKNTIKSDETFAGSRPNPVGIPGSRSNLPGTEAQNPGLPVATNSTEKNMQNTSFSIPRKVQIIDKPSGAIKRLTVAVVVDGTYAKGAAGGADTFVPRGEEELKRIQDIVGNAVGVDAQRRDSVTVNSMPFRGGEETVAPEVPNTSPWYEREEFLQQVWRNSLLAGIVLLFFFFVLRPFLRWVLVADVPQEFTSLPRTVAELEAARKEDALLALSSSPGLLPDAEPLEKKEEEDLRTKILDRMGQSPKKGFSIVQDWLEEAASQLNDAVEG